MLFSLRCLSWLWCSPASSLRPYLVKPKPIFLLSKGAQSSLMQLLQASWGKPGRGHLGRLRWSQNSTVVKQVNPRSRREREAFGPHHMLPGQQGSAGCLSGTLPTHLPLFWRPISCWVNTGHGTLSAEWACLLARPQYHLDSSGVGVRVTRVAVLYGWPSWGCYHCPFLEMAEVSSLLSSSPSSSLHSKAQPWEASSPPLDISPPAAVLLGVLRGSGDCAHPGWSWASFSGTQIAASRKWDFGVCDVSWKPNVCFLFLF